MLKKFKDSREAAHAQKARAEAEERLNVLVWQANEAYNAYRLAKLEEEAGKVPGVQLKSGEFAYLVLNGVGMVEPRRGPSKWVGGSQGVSFKVSKNMRYRVGQTRGHVVQGEEKPTVIDIGVGVVTNKRMVFVGEKRSTEWAFSKLLGFSLEGDSMAIFNVSNRQKASGFAYGAEHDTVVDAIVSAAIAAFSSAEDHAAVIDGYLEDYTLARAEWAELNQQLNPPTPSSAFPPPSLPT